MRATDYTSTVDVYRELTLEEKLRAALVEGMSPRYPPYIRERHIQLVQKFTGLRDIERVETFHRFLAHPSFRRRNNQMFLDYLAQFEPINGLWKPLPEREMVEAGVLVDAKSTDKAGLVREIESTYACDSI